MNTSEDEKDLEEEIQKNLLPQEDMIEGPSDENVEVWEEIWDEDLARKFHEHHWAHENVKIIDTSEAGVGMEHEEIEAEFIFPSDPNDARLVPRVDVD